MDRLDPRKPLVLETRELGRRAGTQKLLDLVVHSQQHADVELLFKCDFELEQFEQRHVERERHIDHDALLVVQRNVDGLVERLCLRKRYSNDIAIGRAFGLKRLYAHKLGFVNGHWLVEQHH